jgi:hypothetical protein
MTAEGVAWLIGIGLIAVAWHAGACWLWPFTVCGKCKGSGARRSPSGKNYGRCRKCKGSPERLRLGRRFYNRFFGH